MIKLLDDGKHLKAVLKTQITWREISSLIIVIIISAIKVLFRQVKGRFWCRGRLDQRSQACAET